MPAHLSAMFLSKLVLPLTLGVCVMVRQNLFSFLYLLLLFVLPFVKVPTAKTMAGWTGRYLLLVVVVSVLTTVAQLSFHIVLLCMPPYAHFIKNCELLEMVLRHVGLVPLNAVTPLTAVRLVGPELLLLAVSIAVHAACVRAVRERRPSHASEASVSLAVAATTPARSRNLRFLASLGKYLVLALLCLAGALRPSVLGGVYFLVFLGAMTWWACYRPLGRPFAVVLRVVLVMVVCHVVALFAVQLQYVQEQLPAGDCDYCRYLGLTVLVTRNCSQPQQELFADADWDSYANPAVLLLLFYLLALQSRALLKPRVASTARRLQKAASRRVPLSRQLSQRLSQRRTSRWRSATRRVRLMGAVTPPRRFAAEAPRSPGSLQQDAHGSVTINDGYDDIQMRTLGTKDEDQRQSSCEKLVDCAVALGQWLARSSYVATSITMMAWSITYHSWLTFTLLLWASVLWVVPNQRRSMLRSSPFLVLYACGLLLAQYVYGMDLTERELPGELPGVNLRQIGLVKCLRLPVAPLVAKSLYTVMFWLTLRQFMREQFEKRTASTLQDMAAPLHITVGTASAGLPEQLDTSPFIKHVGELVQGFLTKFWIWVVAIMLFAISFVGTKMTVMRIIYMALFLFFILTFQISYSVWRKTMYAFWLVVILYSMSILVLIYTYQFDNFSDYWAEYLGVPKDIQEDLGLERYETGVLFARLLVPAFFLVITVIQLHYYHHGFLAISQLSSRSLSVGRASQGSKSETTAGNEAEPEAGDMEPAPLPSLRTLKHLSREQLAQIASEVKHYLEEFQELLWRFLELHLMKLMMLSVAIMCIYDVCALHFVLLVLVVVAMSFGRKVMVCATRLIAVLVAVLLLARMIYQIDFFQHARFDANCTNSSDVGLNNAAWLGFHKTMRGETLAELIKGYIGLIVLATVFSVVDIRQMYVRHIKGACLMRPNVLFPNVRRSNADDNIRTCLKFLLNYGFYKFGVEVCLVMTVVLIASRMDVYAVLYGLWLCALCCLHRETLSVVWKLFQVFLVVVIPLQYAMTVGLPPGLCIDYPWDHSDTLRRLQDWMYLLDPVHSPPSKRLLCDVILLLLVCRQSIVFSVEKRRDYQNYPGGSNKDISKETHEQDFVNPVPDFMTHTRSWLDVGKRVVLQVFLWVILGFMFLAGTNRVNVFSVGYLVGTFVFLWQGEETYLLPVPRILRRWNCLLGYNVAVMVAKSLLQIVGCVFIKEALRHACWAVQLLGISCVQEIGDLLPPAPSRLTADAETLSCAIPIGNTGLVWDAVCFAGLIFMRRLFGSYYFLHIVDETKAMTILASRGAELIEELRLKRIVEQQERERQVLEKIKQKMERIKASQQRLQGAKPRDPQHHFRAPLAGSSGASSQAGFRTPVEGDTEAGPTPRAGSLLQAPTPSSALMTVSLDGYLDPRRISFCSELLQRPPSPDESYPVFSPPPYGVAVGQGAPWRPQGPSSHHTSIRSGDYYMFEELDNVDLEDYKELNAEEQDDSKRVSLGKFLSTAMKTDMEKAADLALSQQPSSGDEVVAPFPSTSTAPPSSIHSDVVDMSAAGSKLSSQLEPGPSSRRDASPSSSVGSQHHLDSDQPTKQTAESVWSRIWTYVKFVWALLESAMVSMTTYLNRKSKDYRYIKMMLTVEKKILKASPDFRKETATSSAMWEPLRSVIQSMKSKYVSEDIGQAIESQDHFKKLDASCQPEIAAPEIRVMAPSLERGLDQESASGSGAELSEATHSPLVQLCVALYYSLMSHSELVCYFMVFLHHIKSATVLSLPLPLMVFLWGTLTVPRPTKTFWIVLIAYTECVVIVKCLFQFELIPWNQQPILDNMPFSPARIIGIERKPNYATYDLALLLIIFFHKVMLKSMGLWKSRYEDPVPFAQPRQTFLLEEDEVGAGDQPVVRTRAGRRLSAIRSEEELDADADSRQLVLVCTEPQPGPPPCPLATGRYLGSVRKFFENLLAPTARVTADVYTYMFLCDFFNFLVIIFGFSAFGTQQGDGGVAAYLEENKVPVPFLLMLILQFALIIIDRALYLRKFILGKIAFQFLLVVGIHIWMFFVLPAVTERQFNASLPPQMWYMVKCFYLLLSAYQIRCGYPTRILGNVICKGYNMLNLVMFKVYLLVPFLFELRTLMDWMWTDTSMTLFDWLKLEDIFNNIFQHKCSRRMEDEYPQPRGQRKNPTSKYLMGGGFLLAIIAIIWFPLVLFALGSTVGQANLPYDVTVSVRIGPYQPVYHMSAQNNSIYRLGADNWTQVLNAYQKDKVAQTFLSGYDDEDVGVVSLGGNSTAIWGASPPDMQRLLEEVESRNSLVFKLDWRVSRQSNTQEYSGIAKATREWVMGADDPQRTALAEMLSGKNSSRSVTVRTILPKFLKVTNRNTAEPVPQLLASSTKDDEEVAYRNLSIHMYKDSGSLEFWWELKEDGCASPQPEVLRRLPFFNKDCEHLILYTFNEKAFPKSLSFISGGGIIALYSTFVIVAFKVLRDIVSGSSFKIMFEDLPNVDRILQLCLDIYLVREAGEFALEEDLFAKLVFLYRSPETLIKWTRPPEEVSADEEEALQ
ncbi:piezo-type mechanosensitive ion channel component-like isoform X4 [Bacillus rossius redtenbacheri]|uniref:piezo-type mechanosensitive ion channel component-like isoform X4 n=1 Tax=Bacillus rossius redtenbacheri TaxID=93214 RepID=UPI002FDD1DFD